MRFDLQMITTDLSGESYQPYNDDSSDNDL